MSFIKFFWKEFRSDKVFNWFFVICLGLGIFGLLLVESFKVGIEDKVSRSAKNLIAGDLSISSRQAIDEDVKEDIEIYLNDKKYPYAQWVETYSLVSKVVDTEKFELGNTKLADLNFVSEEFPFYGGIKLENGDFYGPGDWGNLHETPQVYLSRDLSWDLDTKVGDVIRIGELNFEVGGIIIEDDFSSFRGFNLAPKVFISHNYIEQTELIKFGSTATTSYSVKLPKDSVLADVQKELKSVIPDKVIRIRGPTEANRQVERSLGLLSDYLSLITLMTYLLSLVGLYYFSQHFLSKKIKTFNIYKSLGLTTGYLFKINFAHLIFLTVLAVFISSGLVFAIIPFLQNYVSNLAGESLFFRLNLSALLRILILSVGGSLLALGPLYWGAMQTPVATIFQDLPMQLKRIKLYYFIPLAIYIVVLSIVLSNSFKVGGLFIIALTLIVVISGLLFKVLTTVLDRLSENFQFINKHASKTLSRYFSSSFTIFICLLMGMTLTTFIFQLEGSLKAEFTQDHSSRRPDLFVFDLQDSQEELFDQLTKDNKWNRTMMSAMIRARMIRINDQDTAQREEPGEAEDTSFETREDQQAKQFKNRGVNLSYRAHLSWSESIVKGAYNGEKCNPDIKPCEISLEESYARRIGAKIGDKLVFDVSGIEVEGVVTSLRRIKWTSFEPNFFILFQPGLLEEAPKTFLASIKANSFEEKKKIFTELARSFPTVSILEVTEMVKKISSVFDLMSLAIKLISFLSLFVAFVVLVAVSFNHLSLRKSEMTLFYMMGLKLDLIKKLYEREFLILITSCSVLAFTFGSLLTTIIMKKAFDSYADLRLVFVISMIIILGGFLYCIVKMRVRKLLKTKSLF